MASEESPIYAPFFGVMGAASAIIFSGELRKMYFLFILGIVLNVKTIIKNSKSLC